MALASVRSGKDWLMSGVVITIDVAYQEQALRTIRAWLKARTTVASSQASVRIGSAPLPEYKTPKKR